MLVELGLLSGELDIGAPLGVPPYIPIAVGVSFASLGAGLLSGSGGLPFVFGALLAWWVISPVAVAMGWVPAAAEVGGGSVAAYENFLTWDVGYYGMLRPMGIGILIGGALSGVVASFPAIRAALKGLSMASKAGGSSDERAAACSTVASASRWCSSAPPSCPALTSPSCRRSSSLW